MLHQFLEEHMAHSHVQNYVIPGLKSSLIGGEGYGKVRMFSQQRTHEEPITPHSHRFDFACVVLAGVVRNRIWTLKGDGDYYQATKLIHHGTFGDQTRKEVEHRANYIFTEEVYGPGEVYEMKANQIHSIYFSKGARVLFFEGPNYSMESVVLEPIVDDQVIPTFKVEPWMFRKE